MSCSYFSDNQLARWDGVCNPMGTPCYDCIQECVHNPNWDFENDCVNIGYSEPEE